MAPADRAGDHRQRSYRRGAMNIRGAPMINRDELPDFPWEREQKWMELEESYRRFVDDPVEKQSESDAPLPGSVEALIGRLRKNFDVLFFEKRPMDGTLP